MEKEPGIARNTPESGDDADEEEDDDDSASKLKKSRASRALFEKIIPPAEAKKDKKAEQREKDDDDVEKLTAEEEKELEAFLIDARLAELRAGEGQDTTEEDGAVRQANIAHLEQQRAELDLLPADDAVVETIADELVSAAPETDVVDLVDTSEVPEQPDQPAEIEEDQEIPLSSNPQPTQTPTLPPPPQRTGNTPPPPPQTPPVPPTGGNQPPPRGPAFQNFGGNYQPPLPSPNVAQGTGNQVAYTPDYRVNPNASYLLVGGLVGYFLGRRRGRIKTERRMKVVQNKLEKQIEAKQNQIVRQEVQIQRLARENYRQKFERPKAAAAPASQSSEQFRPDPEANPDTVRSLRAVSPEAIRRAQTYHEKRVEEVATRPNQVPPSRERVGKAVELQDKDLVALGERISVGKTNLRKIYEAKLVSESGLRRLVHEHMEGRDIRRALAREFLAKELSYERDPQLRDALQAGNQTAARAASAVITSQDEPADLPTVARSTAATSDKSKAAQPSKHKTQAVSTGLLAILTLVALGLAVYAVLLSVHR